MWRLRLSGDCLAIKKLKQTAKDVIVAGGFHRGRERSKGKEEEGGAREGSGGGKTKCCSSCFIF